MTDNSGPDAFIVVHHPAGADPYGVGPFPPDDRLAERLVATSGCTCVKTILWVAFPPGVVMGVALDVEEIIGQIVEAERTAQTEKDRLN